jgi:hypothetical protein
MEQDTMGNTGTMTGIGRTPIGRFGLLVVVVGLLAALAIGAFSGASTSPATVALQGDLGAAAPHAVPLVAPASATPAGTPVPGLTLGIDANPHAICVDGQLNCAAGAGVSRVTMEAIASPNGVQEWPAVQVAFVVETTLFDGVYDPNAGDPGTDPCAQGGNAPCEESNGVPFFVAHAQEIANAISDANPNTQVSFAMVDYFATLDAFDDGDGSEYHVDIPAFIPAADFGAAVEGSFQANVLGGGFIYSDSDFSDNIIHSSSITALYGAIVGSGLDWSKDTHHVVVWIGDTVPRDPGYSVNYAVSPSDYSGCSQCQSPTCEPSYNFGQFSSPNCEGWIRSQDGNSSHSIAQLARTAASCTDSVGGVCTIDTIDLYTGMTDMYSKDWPAGRTGGGPNGPIVRQDVSKILEAGCDLAAATGGTWTGPSFFSCPNGQVGTLSYVGIGNPDSPDLSNPTLLAAFRAIGFGPIQTKQVANGTDRPLFQFVPFGNVQLAPATDGGPQFSSYCTLQNGVLFQGPGDCLPTPATVNGSNGLQYYGWNWSTNASQNQMYIGDAWSVSFNVIVAGPPYTTVPVDACTTYSCKVAGSHSNEGEFTSASFTPITNSSSQTESFPVATLLVEVSALSAIGVAPPPPPPIAPPGFGLGLPATVSIQAPIGIGAQVGVANIALQATATGFLAAGFIRVSQRNRPISMAVAAMAGTQKFKGSKFDQAKSGESGHSIGRFV